MKIAEKIFNLNVKFPKFVIVRKRRKIGMMILQQVLEKMIMKK
jgi:hypothetical protein